MIYRIPLVSIIIPTYNSAQFIEEAVTSALSQSYKNIEVIVVDDGSDDDTKKVLLRFKDSIKYIYQDNQGESEARNVGINASKGKYIIFLDSDDTLFPDCIAQAVLAFGNNPDYKAAYGITYNFNNEAKSLSQWNHTPRYTGNIFSFIIKGLTLSPGQFIIERSITEEVGNFDTDIQHGEDWQFLLKLTKKYEFLFVPAPFVKKRIHEKMQTMQSLINKEDIVKRRLSILAKTFGASQAERIRKEYLSNRIIADWYNCESFLYLRKGLYLLAYKNMILSFRTYSWRPRLYVQFLRQIFKRKQNRKQNIKIAISSSGLEHIKRGVETSARNLAYGLYERGINITLYKGSNNHNFSRNGMLESVLPCFKRTSKLTEIIRKVRPASFWHIGLGSEYDIEQTSFSIFLLLEVLFKQYDIIHTQDPVVANVLNTASKFKLIKSKVIFANGTEEPLEFIKKFDYVQHLAPFHLQEAEEQGIAGKQFVIPNFVDIDKFKPRENSDLRKKWGFKDNDFIILSVAAIKRHHKRIDYLIKEVSKIEANNFILIVAGSETNDTALLKHLGETLLKEKIRFLVDLPYEKMPEIYNIADLFILCSLKEMLGNAIIEALSSGLPCICNIHPVLEWVVGKGGECVDMSKEGVLAKTVEKYFNKDLRDKISKEARTQAINNFSKGVVLDKMIDMFRSVLNGR